MTNTDWFAELFLHSGTKNEVAFAALLSGLILGYLVGFVRYGRKEWS